MRHRKYIFWFLFVFLWLLLEPIKCLSLLSLFICVWELCCQRIVSDLLLLNTHVFQSFLAWANHLLASKGVTVTDLREDFKDGVNFILLLEALTNRHVGRYNRHPRFKSQKLDNILVALSFIERTWDVKVLGVNPNGTLSFF